MCSIRTYVHTYVYTFVYTWYGSSYCIHILYKIHVNNTMDVCRTYSRMGSHDERCNSDRPCTHCVYTTRYLCTVHTLFNSECVVCLTECTYVPLVYMTYIHTSYLIALTKSIGGLADQVNVTVAQVSYQFW